MYGTIYKITCLSTGMIYIGQTIKTIEQRLFEHIKTSKRTRTYKSYLYNAINTYGEENFIIESVDKAESKEELNEKEIYWISKLDSRNPNVGYNIQEGGLGGKIRSDDYKPSQKQLDSLEYGRKLPASSKQKEQLSKRRRGISVSETTRQKLRDARKSQVFSAETRAKLSEAHKGKRLRSKTNEQKHLAKIISSDRVHIHKGNVNKNPKKSELQSYLDSGWELGYVYSK